MDATYVEGKTFERTDFRKNPPVKADYEDCTFIGCELSEVNLSGINFISCRFEECNLSLAKLGHTGFRDTEFIGCKLLGLRFADCNENGLSVNFKRCNLRNASFYRTKLKKTLFSACDLQETDFGECDAGGSVFENCDLRLAIFDNSKLEKADFRGSVNYSIDPARNKLKKARFSLTGLPGLLEKYELDIDPSS